MTLLALAGTAFGFLLAYAVFGYEAVYEVGHGAFSLIAATISLTYFWLWLKRATPLALGMSISWAGTSSVMGWWWVYSLLDRPRVMFESPLLFASLAIYFVGGTLHFAVIERSLGSRRNAFLLPVVLSLVVSAMVRRMI